jgi:hypothetical protein
MAVEAPRPHADVNAVVGAYLSDLAFAQSSPPKAFGYKRAANAILTLDRPLTDLLDSAGALPRIPGIGPSSTRVIREILETGWSPTVEQAVEQSERRALRSTATPHTTDQLSYAETALAHARLAAIPADRIFNCWPLERLRAWLANPSSATGPKTP